MFGERGPSLRELARQALSSTRGGYDLLAPKFEETPFCTAEPVIERTVRDLGAVGDALDLCCGTGSALRALRGIARGRVVGVDFSEGMLDVARPKAEEARAELVRADVFALDYAAEFDLVTCFGALGHIEDREERRFLAAIDRALRPGGRFVFLSAYPPPLLSREHLVSRVFNGVMRVRNAVLSPPFVMYYLTFMLPGIARRLGAMGFEVTLREGLFVGLHAAPREQGGAPETPEASRTVRVVARKL